MRFIKPLFLLQAINLGFNTSEKTESLAVGGQAVLEGIMIRNNDTLALAVRRPDEKIVSLILPWKILFSGSWAQKKWIRGFPILIETMLNGIKGLNKSASIAAEAEEEEIKPWQMVLTMCVAFGMALLIFVVVPHLLTVLLGYLAVAGKVEGISFHLWDGLLKMGIFIGYILAISKLPEIARVFAYHGAEHKVIAAYEGGENPITPEAAMPYSRLHPRCGTAFLLFVLCISILLHTLTVPLFLSLWTPPSAFVKHSAVLVFKLLLMAPISALAYEAIRFAAPLQNSLPARIMRAPGLLLQKLTTQEPDIAQLQVALVALHEALPKNTTRKISTAEFLRLES